ncbi:hypothetical protein Glove_144g141 [Diversispora epigaea]|uniref:Protein kinase domain-containing protein n=1 Tax=Diversispora epigaea TaxID=1348612 RepID=A0A397IU19_9GLOM|nr:hypothetical protein Glove_144g141 [Diversispora epigaea]
MTETADQLLSHVSPVCQWIPPDPSTRFPEDVREWDGFFRDVRLASIQYPLPGGQFPVFPTNAQSLEVEEDAKTSFYNNVLWPVETLLKTQGAIFRERGPKLLCFPDYVLCINTTLSKMPVVMKSQHNLNLCGHTLWQIYQRADRDQITDPNFKFKEKILSHVFGEMACNGLHYGILSNYSDTYFLKREEASPTILYVTRIVQPNDNNPTLRECVYYISQLAINDNAGNTLNHPPNDSDDESDDYNAYISRISRRKKQSSKKIGSSKSSEKVVASSSKGITKIDEYIDSGTFGKVFSGYYHGQAVAWKTCDGYKEKEAKKMLRVEMNVYSILKECQGNIIPQLLYGGYIYCGYLYVLALQLIEDAHPIDPANLTVEDKKTIMKQLKTIHSYGVLHNDISQGNILLESKSHRFFFIDFGLSELVGTKSKKLYKEKKILKRLLQI